MKKITVLGVNDGHDSGASIVQNGKILAAVQEERLRNKKHYAGTPSLSIKEVIKISEINPEEIDLIAISSLNRVYSPYEEQPFILKVFEKASPLIHSKTFARFYVSILKRTRNIKELKKCFADTGISEKETMFVEHHHCHASSCLTSGMKPPFLIFTADGAGDGVSSTVNVFEKDSINRIAWSDYYNSLGNTLYTEITAYLGLKRWNDEFKVMGLAPYGKKEYSMDAMKKIIKLDDLEFRNTIGACANSVQGKLKNLLMGHRFDNLAAAVQELLEDLLVKWVKNGIRKTGIRKAAFCGGVFLNVKANKRILEECGLKESFFFPASGDAGTSVGAAVNGYHEYCKRDGIKRDIKPLQDLYLGSSFSDDEISKQIPKKWKRKAERHGDINGVVSDHLKKGKIIARFDGRMEFGPRALGNRSILADPRDKNIVKTINDKIKHRTWWMPFAPTILDKKVPYYLKKGFFSPYMNMAFDTTEKWDEIQAAIHPYDFTCRPQVLNDWNKGYKRVIEEFEKDAGVGAVLNTSFNLHGYPIVWDAKTAIWTFEKSELDGLALGNYLILR